MLKYVNLTNLTNFDDAILKRLLRSQVPEIPGEFLGITVGSEMQTSPMQYRYLTFTISRDVFRTLSLRCLTGF